MEQPPSARKTPSRIAMALESLKLCGVVVIGFAIGLSGLAFLQHDRSR